MTINDMWEHQCPVNGAMMVGVGEPCSWCGARQAGETIPPGDEVYSGSKIGYCGRCGAMDHHLINGLCANCNERAITIDATEPLGVEAADVSTVDGYRVGDKHPAAARG